MRAPALFRIFPASIGALIAASAMMLLLIAPAAAAASLTATLTGGAEVPDPGDPDGTGSATVDVDAAAGTLCYTLNVSGVEAPTAAHIHSGAAGTAGDVEVNLTTPTGSDPYTADACITNPDDYVLTDSGDFATVAELLADIEANPQNYYVNVHNAAFPGGAVRGQLALAPTQPVTVMVMKHNCADVTTVAEFEAVEARAATNPTTPDAAFGPTVETVLECPTVVLPGDTQSPNTVAGGSSTFEFTVTTASSAQTLSSDSTFTQTAACETDVSYDANRNGSLDADVCLDLSHYEFNLSTDGMVTITETAPPAGFQFGALRFTPGSGDEATLVSASDGVIQLDVSGDGDEMVMLHVYNFAVAAGAPEPTPAASMLPDAAATAPVGTGGLPLAILAAVAVAASFAGLRVVSARRGR